MPFAKGDRNINREGRPKGIENKGSGGLRKKWLSLLHRESESFSERLKETQGLSYWKAIEILAKYAVPALKTIELETDAELVEILNMSKEERVEFGRRLCAKHEARN